MASATTLRDLVRTYRLERAVGEAKVSWMELEPGEKEFWLSQGNHCWRAILCLQGAISVTQDRDVQDHIGGPAGPSDYGFVMKSAAANAADCGICSVTWSR